ncbi:hypothetical protein ACJJTC_007192 [Scirpophaga incertulas]
MELVSFAKEIFQKVAEHVASYRIGQSALRQLDYGLWVVEKCARWAVPPPLDQDEAPQPELVRPLPWVFLSHFLIILRVTRESISIIYLFMGKPPLRSADVVMYIQSKRRYLRALKYQGNRMMRARTSTVAPQRSWYSRLQALLEFTMCFRSTHNYGNNNTTHVSNNEEVLVVKRTKRGRKSSSPVASSSEIAMERLIEKMMIDLDGDSDDDTSFTLTNVTSIRSDQSDTIDSDQDTVLQNETPENEMNDTIKIEISTAEQGPLTPSVQEVEKAQKNNVETKEVPKSEEKTLEESSVTTSVEDAALQMPIAEAIPPPKEGTQSLLQSEKDTRLKPRYSPKNEQKIGNGQIMNTRNKKKAELNDRKGPELANKSPKAM